MTLPVLVDEGLKLFRAYGVITVPSTALIDDRGELAGFFPGYAHEQREALFDALDKLAGITRGPAAVETPRGSPAAVRRLQLGRAQLAQGRIAAARASFEAAASDTTIAEPIVELAALALDEGDLGGARTELGRAAAIEASSRALRRERARLDLLDGKPAEAQAALLEMTADARDALAQAYLGFSLLLTGAGDAAAGTFDRVAERSGVDPRRFLTPPQSVAPGDIARAMVAFRHAVAVKVW